MFPPSYLNLYIASLVPILDLYTPLVYTSKYMFPKEQKHHTK